MSILDAFRVAARAIAANGLRSILTTLGMIIGVGSVIVLIAVGQGAQQGVQKQIRALGQDLMFVKPAPIQGNAATGGARGAAGSGNTLTMEDATAIREANLPGVLEVAPQDSPGFQPQVVAGGHNMAATMVATTPEYPDVRGVQIAEGSFITATDVERNSLVTVLGSDLAVQLFPDGGAVGQTVRLAFGRSGLLFKVEGVMAPKGGSGGGAQDDYFYMPATTLQRRFGGRGRGPRVTYIDQINLQMAPKANQDAVKAAVSDLLLQRHKTTQPDFSIQTQDDLLGAAGDVSRTLSILLGSIAGISLVVGGIGVMNIMLVSVTERTREIGIRRAVGARAKDIILQFVTEALTLCVGGGLLGVLIGGGLAIGIDGRQLGGQTMNTVIQPWSIGVAFVVSSGIGFLSGSYPAYRASRLDPITALRNE
jgi:putative ABC transport system permease protein